MIVCETDKKILFIWLLATIAGIVLAALNISRNKQCRDWKTSESQKTSFASGTYLVTFMALQFLLILFFIFREKIVKIISRK
jgi:hypothetical protein